MPTSVDKPIEGSQICADVNLTLEQLKRYLQHYAGAHTHFTITIFKQNGQGYSLVLHPGDGKKIRVQVTKGGTYESSWVVRDVLEVEFTPEGEFSEEIKAVVDSTLMGSLGSVLLVVENGLITAAHFHAEELWP